MSSYKKPRRQFIPRFFFNVHWNSSIEIIFIMLLLINLPIQTMLTIKDGETGKIVFNIPIQVGGQFSIRYIHSIHKTPVTEFYSINKDLNIVVDKVIFKTYGVGMQSDIEAGEKFKIENGNYVLNHLNRVLPYFDQRIGQVIANHQLTIGNNTIPLSKISKSGNWIRFQVKKESLFEILKGGY